MNDPQHEPTREEIGVVAFKVWGYKQGELVSLLIHLGDRLGLYRAMAGAGPLAVDEVAGRTGLHARWVLEWLRGLDQVASVRFASVYKDFTGLADFEREVDLLSRASDG